MGYVPPQNSYSLPGKGRRLSSIILGIVVAVMALIAFGIWRGVAGYSGATKAAVPVSNQFINSLRSHDYKAAEAMMIPEARQETSAFDIGDIEQLEEKRGGALESYGSPQPNVQYYNGAMYVTLTYGLQYQNRSRRLQITTQRMPDESYKVRAFQFDR